MERNPAIARRPKLHYIFLSRVDDRVACHSYLGLVVKSTAAINQLLVRRQSGGNWYSGPKPKYTSTVVGKRNVIKFYWIAVCGLKQGFSTCGPWPTVGPRKNFSLATTLSYWNRVRFARWLSKTGVHVAMKQNLAVFNVEDDLICALSCTEPRISLLSNNKQAALIVGHMCC